MGGFSKNSQFAIIGLLGLIAIGAGYITEMGWFFVILSLLFVAIGWAGIPETSAQVDQKEQEEKDVGGLTEEKPSSDII